MNCDKIGHKTYKEALDQIKGLVKRVKSKSGYRVYKCNDCGQFHVTTIKTKPLVVKKDKYKLKPEELVIKKEKPQKVSPKKNQPSVGIQTTGRIMSLEQAQFLKRLIQAS